MNMHGFCFTVHSMIYAFLMMLCVKSGSFAPYSLKTCLNIRGQVDRIREMFTTENVSMHAIDFSLFLVHFNVMIIPFVYLVHTYSKCKQ